MSDAWFSFYPGDYTRDTRDLSLAQHGAYFTLLIFYYSSGGPLPSDRRALYRIAVAQDDEERVAVDSVTDRFFVLRDGVYHNDRADRELAKRSEHHKRLSDAGRKRWPKPSSSQAVSQATCQAASEPIASPQPQPEPYKSKNIRASHDGVCDELLSFWNQNKGSLPGVLKLGKSRSDKLAARIKSDSTFPEIFKCAVHKARETPFCIGAGGQGWRANFDWFIANDTNCIAVLEGKYDSQPTNGPGKLSPIPMQPRREVPILVAEP